MHRTGVLIWIMLLSPVLIQAQSSAKMTREEYIRKYAGLAVKEMKRSGIPASITLAQGLLESDNGNSRLAVKGNNHFGIKCHDWKGKKIYHDDDERNECFRKYKDVYESYKDHSDFLMNSSRYAFLFELDYKDYKGWSRGLKKAGYATSRSYAQVLIRIIEENELYRYDQGYIPHPDEEFEIASADTREILEKNRVDYIIVEEGDTYMDLTRELGMMRFELARYNEAVQKNSDLVPGSILYLQPKRNRAERGEDIHVVQEGESMYGISQEYAVKLKKLYKKNNMEEGTRPEPGDTLSLRKNRKKILSAPVLPGEKEEESDFRIEIEEEL